MYQTEPPSKAGNPFIRAISDEELARYAHTTIAQRMEWISHWATIYRNSTTREERIAHYRLKEGENVKHYDTYGWPEHF